MQEGKVYIATHKEYAEVNERLRVLRQDELELRELDPGSITHDECKIQIKRLKRAIERWDMVMEITGPRFPSAGA